MCVRVRVLTERACVCRCVCLSPQILVHTVFYGSHVYILYTDQGVDRINRTPVQ